MIVYPTTDQILHLHSRIIATSGGDGGILNAGAIESAVAQPQTTFDGEDMYPQLADKAAAIGFSFTMNHAFVDGNKRIGHAAMELLLRLNGYRLLALVDEQEQIMLSTAAGRMSRDEFSDWVRAHVVPLSAQDETP